MARWVFISWVVFSLATPALMAEGDGGEITLPRWAPTWSSVVNRPQVVPQIYSAQEAPHLETQCPTGYPNCPRLLPKKDRVFTNSLRREVIIPVSRQDLDKVARPGDVIVFVKQGVMLEGGLSAVVNGAHHTALVGINPDGTLSYTASPKPKDGTNWDEEGDGFHILRFNRWPKGMTPAQITEALGYVQKYYDILYRSDPSTGAVFDYQGDMDIIDRKVLDQFAKNLKAAPPGALMEDIFPGPGGIFRVFCSESAMTAYALALRIMGYSFDYPRTEGMHQGIDMIVRDFRREKAACRGGQCDDLTVMMKVMDPFFLGEALRLEHNDGDDPSGSKPYTPEERKQMARQLLVLIKMGPKLAHAAVWGLKVTGLDRHLGDYVRKAWYDPAPYDIVVDAMKSHHRAQFEYVGTYIGPKSEIRGDQLVTRVEHATVEAIAASAASPQTLARHQRRRRHSQNLMTALCSFGDLID